MSHPESCECEICQSGSPSTEQRIAALEEQLQIRDAEIHLLKESRAAAVSQDQSSRVERNKLRTQLAEAQAACAAKDAVLNWACDCPPGDHAHQCQQALDEALRQAKFSTFGQDFLAERDRLRKALEFYGNPLTWRTGPSKNKTWIEDDFGNTAREALKG